MSTKTSLNPIAKDAITKLDKPTQVAFRLPSSVHKKLKKLLALNEDTLQTICESAVNDYLLKHDKVLDQPIRKKRKDPGTANIPAFTKRK